MFDNVDDFKKKAMDNKAIMDGKDEGLEAIIMEFIEDFE